MAASSGITWKSIILLNVAEPVWANEAPNFATLSERDVCSFIHQKDNYHNMRLYFGKTEYPNANEETAKALQDSIIDSAKANGTSMVRAGFRKKGDVPHRMFLPQTISEEEERPTNVSRLQAFNDSQ